jgi:quinol monooxygenase YgiN
MFIVVSKWKAKPGLDEEFENKGRKMRDLTRKMPGVLMVEAFKAPEGHIVAVHCYADEAAYKALVQDEAGEFNKAAQAEGIEQAGEWLGSERGEALV